MVDTPISIAFFPNVFASEVRQEHVTLQELAHRIKYTNAGSKKGLPLLKASGFDLQATEKGSLRSDSSITWISGVEADYDGELIPFEQAVETAGTVGLRCIVYTSPSHTPERPRWRVLAPVSEHLPPAARYDLVSRLNGLFKGCFSTESWTLSQSYYYGSVDHNPAHDAVALDGAGIDQMIEWDACAVGKPQPKSASKLPAAAPLSATALVPSARGRADEQALLDEIVSGASYHQASLSLLGLWAQRATSRDDARQWLEDAMNASAGPRDARWTERMGEIERTLEWVYRKEAQKPPKLPLLLAATVVPPEQRASQDAALRDYLSAGRWRVRSFAPPVRLLGDLVTNTTRGFLVGPTGLGKTMLAMAMASGMATGKGLLHWRCERPCRVLYVDGEMPGELVQSRMNQALERLELDDDLLFDSNLHVYCADTADAIAEQFPHLGPMPPLNSEAGHAFVLALLDAIGGVDVVIFDNVMSLVVGDQKDEIPWSQAQPLVMALTRGKVGQVWLDHTGHNASHQYGSSTKSWKFDFVAMMSKLEADQLSDGEMAFKLSFAKARRRTPDNWNEFKERTIRLGGEGWTSEDEAPNLMGGRGRAKLPPSRAKFLSTLNDAIVSAPAGLPRNSTLVGHWISESIRRGFIEAEPSGETSGERQLRLAEFRNAKTALLNAGWIGIDGERVTVIAPRP